MTTHGALSGSRPITAYLDKLVRWVPSRAIAAYAGELYLTKAVHVRMNPANDGRDALRVATSAAFDQFVERGEAAHPLFDDSFGRLGVAQLKVLGPTPGTRLVGGFADPTLFVGLRIYWRDELPFRRTKQPGVIDYKTLGAEVATDWDALLPSILRMPMKDFDNDR